MLGCLALLALSGCDSSTQVTELSATQSSGTQEDGSAQKASKAKDVKDENLVRTFDFKYAGTATELKAGQRVRIWIPQPSDSEHQTVEAQSTTYPSTVAKKESNEDGRYGNQIHYFEATADEDGKVAFEFNYRIKRHEATEYGAEEALSDEEIKNFTGANAMVPIDGKPIELLDGKQLPTEMIQTGRALYDTVFEHMTYDKSKPGYGKGDSIWACDSRTGNCTDFHSLFISLARSQKIPSRFEIGFPLPPVNKKKDNLSGKIGGYHCWAWFHAEGSGWVPVDISEADKHPEMKEFFFGHLTKDRVAFSSGRDIKLVPAADSEPLNYFVYPHIEVDGKKWPKDKIELDFSYSDPG